MVVQKLTPTSNWVSRKDAIYAFFFVATEARSGVDRGQARRGKIRVLARFALEFARLKKAKKI